MRNFVYLKIIFILLLFVNNTNCNANGNFAIEKDTIVPKKHLNNSNSEINKNHLLSNIAPEIHTTSNLTPYCPGSFAKIVDDVTIIDPDDTSTNAVYIQISTGYTANDKLKLNNEISHLPITASWDATAGKLKLFNISGAPVSYIDFIKAIKDVQFNNPSPILSGSREFSVTIGQANYLPFTSHYYQFIPSLDIKWTEALTDAAASNYFGLQGYLSTITSLEESDFVRDKLADATNSGAGWIGGTDESTPNIWKWVTGPEAGTIFWNGGPALNSTSPTFAFWNSNEPNNPDSEFYAHIVAPGTPYSTPGSWNNLSNSGSSEYYQPKGYIVEYGGMPGDPTLHISDYTSLTIAKIASTTPGSRCGSGSLTLSATTSAGTPRWYDSANNGTLLYTGNTLITPNLTSTTIYYVDAGCPGTRTSVTATVNPLPIVNPIEIKQCSENSLFYSTFNLTEKNDAISSNFANETFTYYTSETEAINDINKISTYTAYVNISPNETVWTRVANTISKCFSIAKIYLKVSVTQLDPTTFHKNIEICDDALPNDQDGFSEFDFHTVTTDIQNEIDPLSNNNYSIKYYITEADALSEINIINPSSFRNTTKGKQDIWVRIDSDLDNSCYGIGKYVTLTVNPVPNINMNTNGAEDVWVCDNLPNYYVTLTAGIQAGLAPSDYDYIWKKDGNPKPVGTNSSTLDVNLKGVYTVEVKNKSFGCSRTRTITVRASNSATIDTIEIIDLTDVNSVTVMVTGPGNYEYSLDEPTGPWQDSNIFDNVSAGIHDVYINDKNGCGFVPKTIAVIGAPKFFTPNNDSYNDYWSVKGVNETFNSKSIIYIFDRYGKLIKQWIPTINKGWDGTVNGIPLPADDYWFTLKLEDGREAKGHFSLKR